MKNLTTLYLVMAFLLAVSGLSVAADVAGWEAFVIRNSTDGDIAPEISDHISGGKLFAITLAGQKAGWSTNSMNGRKVGDIQSLSITRDSSVTGYGPYINIWITDGNGEYAVLANEPSNTGEWGTGTPYDTTWDILKDATAKIYEYNPEFVKPDGTTYNFNDFAGYTIATPPSHWGGTGAPDDLNASTYTAYGFNWVFGDTQSNYIGGYLVSNPTIVALPVQNITQGTSHPTIKDGVDSASAGDTIIVAAGTYIEQVNLIPGTNLTILGAGKELVTWIAPTGGCCIYGSMSGYTGSMNYEISGFTFNCRAESTSTWGVGIQINRASSGPLNLCIHDNRFIENDNKDGGHWATSMLLCHNRFAGRDIAGNGAVRIYNNIDLTLGGMTMSNSQAYDIYNNVFDGCSDAIYNGHGCPDTAGQTFGDHRIYNNVFKNAHDFIHPGYRTPAIDWQHYGAGGGTHLPSIIEKNSFEDNDTAIRFVMDTDMSYPAHQVTCNSFQENGTAVLVDGAYASTVSALYNWWGSSSGPGGAGPGTGDVVSANVDYDPWTIHVECIGFESPMDRGTVVADRNKVLPFVGELVDEEGNTVTDVDITPPVIQVIFNPSSPNEDPYEVEYELVGHGTDGNEFFFDSDGKWHFNLKLLQYSAGGTYSVTMVSANECEYVITSICEATFGLKR
jgi:hypothetical protein